MAAGRKSRTLAGQGLRLPDEGVSSGAGVKRACGLLNAGTELESWGGGGHQVVLHAEPSLWLQISCSLVLEFISP